MERQAETGGADGDRAGFAVDCAGEQLSAYTSSLQHVLAELERLDLLRADRALDEPDPERLDELSAEIDRRTMASVEEGTYLRLVVLAQLFGLAGFDVDVVLLALAPELDRRDEPTVDLVLDLLCPDLETKVAARTRLGHAAPLLRHRLVQLVGAGGPLLGDTLRLDPRVARFLLGDDEVDDRLQALARLVEPATPLESLVLPGAVKQQVERLAVQARTGDDHLVLYLQGPYGVGKQATAEACCGEIGALLLVANGRRLAEHSAEDVDALARLVDREARLQGALVYVEDFDALLAEDKQAQLATLLTQLEQHPGPAFLAGTAAWEPQDALRGTAFVRLEIPLPGYDERRELWRTTLAADTVADEVDLAALANTFRLSGGQIGDAAATARSLALVRAGDAISSDDLHAACRLQSSRKLAEIALKVTPRHSWNDLVLPLDQMEQLREVHDQVRYRALVHDGWGFGQKLATGRGLNVLFAGPPGTGKTMATDVLANALGLDLYSIDLSSVLSKYIGETEKNLARIFDEAMSSNAVLFFDEADALFGKRTQVRDAHDRYANVEISYLLQRMEEHQGLVVLATNLRKNMDEAFVRRLHATVEFPMPGLEDRRRLWEQIWPPPAPLDPGLDLELLAREVRVSGGAIRNIALAGAFLAAADGGVVTMQHLVHATQREYKKMGKVLTGGELGSAAS